MIDITDGGPHGALRAAKSIHRRTGSPAGVREVPLAVVEIVEIRASIVGNVNILITVIVEIRENHTKPSAWILSGYSRGLADIREGAIAVVMVKEVLFSLVLLRLAGDRDGLHLTRAVRVWRWVNRLVVAFDIIGDVQVRVT